MTCHATFKCQYGVALTFVRAIEDWLLPRSERLFQVHLLSSQKDGQSRVSGWIRIPSHLQDLLSFECTQV